MTLVRLLALIALLAIPSYAQQELEPAEKREVLTRLLELESCREDTRELVIHIERDRELDAQEKENCARGLELERQATALAEQARDLALERAELYEDLYRGVTRGPGIGCRILRVITLGIHRCH